MTLDVYRGRKTTQQQQQQLWMLHVLFFAKKMIGAFRYILQKHYDLVLDNRDKSCSVWKWKDLQEQDTRAHEEKYRIIRKSVCKYHILYKWFLSKNTPAHTFVWIW